MDPHNSYLYDSVTCEEHATLSIWNISLNIVISTRRGCVFTYPAHPQDDNIGVVLQDKSRLTIVIHIFLNINFLCYNLFYSHFFSPNEIDRMMFVTRMSSAVTTDNNHDGLYTYLIYQIRIMRKFSYKSW